MPHADAATEAELESLKYPIGRFTQTAISRDERNSLIDGIAALPAQVRHAVDDWSQDRLDTAYRPGGWTVRQLVHHLADAHMHAYARFKIALTESEPEIRLHDIDGWAALPESRQQEVEVSLTLLHGLHARWAFLLRSMTPEQFDRALLHPVRGRMTLDATLQLYAWHGRHHLAHIMALAQRLGW
jgi:hypothetical protein